MQNFKILRHNVNIEQLLKEVKYIFSITNTSLDTSALSIQIGLQSDKPDQNWKASIGRADLMTETDFIHTVFDTPILNHYIKKYNMYRTRIMISNPRTCLSWHRDRQPRIHIPIQTDIGCRMVIDGEEMHMKRGKVYIADTTKYHSAMNASNSQRIHIVGCVSVF